MTVEVVRGQVGQNRDLRGLFDLGQLLKLKAGQLQNDEVVFGKLVYQLQQRLVADIAAKEDIFTSRSFQQMGDKSGGGAFSV